MCLWVKKSYVKAPIQEVECIKVLEYRGDGEWVTPYRYRPVPVSTGWFMPIHPSLRRTEIPERTSVHGGYIHAYTSTDEIDGLKVRDVLPTDRRIGKQYAFRAYARDVVAVGNYNDIVCKALYLPAFDRTGAHRRAQIKYT